MVASTELRACSAAGLLALTLFSQLIIPPGMHHELSEQVANVGGLHASISTLCYSWQLRISLVLSVSIPSPATKALLTSFDGHYT